jgi:hypothetical protein
MKHLLCDGNNVHLENNFQDMKTKNKKDMKTKDRRVRTKSGIEYTISDRVIDTSDDPVFNKKHEEMWKFLEKAGHPEFPPRKK